MWGILRRGGFVVFKRFGPDAARSGISERARFINAGDSKRSGWRNCGVRPDGRIGERRRWFHSAARRTLSQLCVNVCIGGRLADRARLVDPVLLGAREPVFALTLRCHARFWDGPCHVRKEVLLGACEAVFSLAMRCHAQFWEV